MSMQSFLSNENKELLWEVLIEEEELKNQPKEFLRQINQFVNEKSKDFYHEERKLNASFSSLPLMEVNKKFITLMIHSLRDHHPQKQQPKKDLITYEEIQEDRKSEFEKQLTQKQNEFTSAMSLSLPPKPIFEDNRDEPMTELEKEIQKVIAQRNYDIEMVNHNQLYQKSSSETWLTSQETSVKKEKLIFPSSSSSSQQPPSFKQIKIENQDMDHALAKKEIIDLNKHIHWEDEKPLLEMDLFKKLKILPAEIKKEDTQQIVLQRLDQLESKFSKIEEFMELILKKIEKQ
jgi:hypothetical protein